MTELRCPRHLHGILRDGSVEVRCHQCSKALGRDVFHRFDARSGRLLTEPGASRH